MPGIGVILAGPGFIVSAGVGCTGCPESGRSRGVPPACFSDEESSLSGWAAIGDVSLSLSALASNLTADRGLAREASRDGVSFAETVLLYGIFTLSLASDLVAEAVGDVRLVAPRLGVGGG